jgi:hypothetical protein
LCGDDRTWRNRGVLDEEGGKRRLKVIGVVAFLAAAVFRLLFAEGGGDRRGRALGGRV